MANSGYLFREIRFVIEDELTHVYVRLEATGDSPIGVQGWHYKVFPPSRPVIDLIEDAADAVMWPQKAPD